MALLVASLFVCADARASDAINGSPTIETYIDQAVPAPQPPGTVPYNAPLKAGQMTLEDVLEAHKPPKKILTQPPVLATVPGPAIPPVIAPPAGASSEGSMLMQGMKAVLQKSGATTATLQPPQLPGSVPNTPAAASHTSPFVPASAPATASGIQYQPGQAPKSLSGGALVETAPSSVAQSVPATTPSAPVAEATAPLSAPASSEVCAPHAEQWTKTCVDAGYPASFTGQIKGETHIACPGNTLQDVWVSNTCAAPVEAETAAPLSAPNASTSSQADGSCGPANGLAANAKPFGDLCASGEATEVVGDGPWRWSCRGSPGGMTVSCAAPVAIAVATPVKTAPQPTEMAGTEEGQCGSSDGTSMDHAPAADLCIKGDASRVSGDGPWTWACSGRNGGKAAACRATKKIDGVCGAATNAGGSEMPTTDLCTAGYASAITGNGPWNWTCSGLYGGAPALCSAAPKKNAVCGPAATSGHREAPRADLCSVGQASSVSGGGPWTWSCNGINGGSAVSCASPISVNGACGSANGGAVMAAPSENLCAHGKPSRVTGEGPWSWNCSGTDAGDTESCTALKGHSPVAPAAVISTPAPAPAASPSSARTGAAEEVMPAPSAAPAAPVSSSSGANVEAFVGCGPASELAAFEAPAKDLCKKGHAGAVTGDGPWKWDCSDDSGHMIACSTLAPADSFGESGASSNANSSAASANASLAEMPAPVAAPEAPVAKTTPPLAKAACGAAAGQGVAAAPTEGLCAVGKSSTLRGNGPWQWTCATKGKDKIACEAPKLEDAACGTANGSIQKSMPGTGLCNSGTPTDIQGTGPWMWSCVGSGGGTSVSCSAASQAQERVDGACGVAANATTSRPSANLCDSGVASTVYGEGPWTWTCSGLNGGVASSCSAGKNALPAPPPPGPTVNGLCGNANGVVASEQPENGLCSTGTATNISGNGPWNWSCIGENGGMTVSCTAPLQPPSPITGVCGAASGVPTLIAPRGALCSAGISSAVSGKGPWTWSCSGTNGGGAVACVAPLAGEGNGAGLPSLVTPSIGGEAAPSKPASSTASSGLVTPHLPAGPLPPLETGSMPAMIPSKPFAAPPEASALPPVPAPGESPEPPTLAPGLPSGTEPLQPPPIRDTLKPSPALRPSAMDEQGKLIPGNHFTLSDDLSMLPFKTGSENIDPATISTLDRLASVLSSNGGVRITLTAYAAVGDSTSPREARRMSLTRALAVRDYLTSKGISSARIDVRALGANVPSGDPDRVDMKAN